MSKVFTGRTLETLKNIKPAEASSLLPAGVYRMRIADCGENRDRNGVFVKGIVANPGDAAFTKLLGSHTINFDFDDRKYGEANMSEFLAIAIATGACTEETAAELDNDDMRGKDIFIGFEMKRRKADGVLYNRAGRGAAWSADTRLSDINWNPESLEAGQEEDFYDSRRPSGHPPRR